MRPRAEIEAAARQLRQDLDPEKLPLDVYMSGMGMLEALRWALNQPPTDEIGTATDETLNEMAACGRAQ